MNKIKLEVMKKEFPFLIKLEKDWDFNYCDNIKIKKIDHELLQARADNCEIIGSMVDISEGTTYCLFDEGQKLIDKVKPDYLHKSNYAYEDDINVKGESIIETIFRCGLPGIKTNYIVKIEYGYDCVNHYSTDNFKITIFKSAKNINLVNELVKETKKFENQVRAEANF